MRYALLFLVGCAAGGAPPVATTVDAERAHVALTELNEGRTLLVGKCGGCHRAPSPTEHAAHEWPKQLDEMAARSNLNDRERAKIEAYLVALAR